ncbi:hypothetical protein ABZ802_31570 [Streptomyces sp. NPDC047737]|uniref:hypothetical protein n=1 Tax=Streptomyces sp. NPDC047737 TaxID=3155740 RepID=UPI0033C8DD79
MPEQGETVVYRSEDWPSVAGTSQLKAIQLWLRANSIDPKNVPITTDLTVTTEPDGQRTIHYEQFVLTSDGHRQVAPDHSNDAWTEAATTLCVAEPPAALRSST